MKYFILLFLISIPLVSLSQETWNKTYLNHLVDFDGYGFSIPSGLFLEDDYIMVFTESGWCYECDNTSRLLYMKIDYLGNAVDTILFPEIGVTGNYWINGHFYYKGMFENENGRKVAILKHYLDTGLFHENYHHTMYHFDQDFNAVDIDTLWGLSNEAHDLSYIMSGLQYDSDSYVLSGYVYDSLTITIPDDGIDTEFGLLAKINKETGENIWKRYYPQYRRFNSLHLDSNGFLWVVASKYSPETYNDHQLLKLDNEGNIIKSSDIFGGLGSEANRYLKLIFEEERILLGGFLTNDEFNGDLYGDGTFFTKVFQETENGFEDIQTKRYGSINYHQQRFSGFYPVDTEEINGYLFYGTYRQTEDPGSVVGF